MCDKSNGIRTAVIKKWRTPTIIICFAIMAGALLYAGRYGLGYMQQKSLEERQDKWTSALPLRPEPVGSTHPANPAAEPDFAVPKPLEPQDANTPDNAVTALLISTEEK